MTTAITWFRRAIFHSFSIFFVGDGRTVIQYSHHYRIESELTEISFRGEEFASDSSTHTRFLISAVSKNSLEILWRHQAFISTFISTFISISYFNKLLRSAISIFGISA